jgi:hypothetical protein
LSKLRFTSHSLYGTTISVKYSLCILVYILSIISPLFADSLELNNGDMISGTIIRIDEEKVCIKTEYGLLEIKREYVSKGIFSGSEENPPEKEEHIQITENSADSEESVPKQGLLCEFLFNRNLIDTSGYGYMLQNNNNVQFTSGMDGRELSAVTADGTGKYLSLESFKELDECHSFSISLWVYMRNSKKSQYLLSKWTSSKGEKAEGKVALNIKGSMIRCFVVDISGYHHNLQAATSLTPLQWYHLVVTCDMGEICIYMDNKIVGKKRFNFSRLKNDNSPLFLFTAKANNKQTWSYYNCDGMIDSLRIYDRLLTEKEIESLYKEF